MSSIIRSIPTYKAYVAVVIWGSWPGQSHVTPSAIGLLERGSLLHAGGLCVYLYLCAVLLVLHCLECEKKNLPTCRLSVSVWKALFPSESVITILFPTEVDIVQQQQSGTPPAGSLGLCIYLASYLPV